MDIAEATDAQLEAAQILGKYYGGYPPAQERVKPQLDALAWLLELKVERMRLEDLQAALLDNEQEAAKRAKTAGLPYAMIGDALGRNHQTAWNYVNGYPPRKRPEPTAQADG